MRVCVSVAQLVEHARAQARMHVRAHAPTQRDGGTATRLRVACVRLLPRAEV